MMSVPAPARPKISRGVRTAASAPPRSIEPIIAVDVSPLIAAATRPRAVSGVRSIVTVPTETFRPALPNPHSAAGIITHVMLGAAP